jgi:adenosylcobinamide kinase/adenosylcobinamide-phosphate guanylyltransferase
MGDVWLVTGGARSGKSRFAERLAAASGLAVTFVATMEPLDDELRERVARHRSERPPAWQTVEAPLDLVRAVSAADLEACVLVDCLSLWVTNRMLEGARALDLATVARVEEELEAEVARLLAGAGDRSGPLILVTNEVGGGVVPESYLGRAFRDVLGRVNQHASLGASRAWLLVAGRAIELPRADLGTP